MHTSTAQEKSNSLLIFINICVVFLVASNLRSPITSVGPVLDEISADLQLGNFQSSLLTSIPLLMFAGFSVLVSRLSYRFSIIQILLMGMLILGFGSVLRVYGNVSTLFAGSFLVGLGICIGNVITPGFIKNNFKKHLGLMTGLFAVGMNLVAAFASGYSVSIGEWTGKGWKGSLGIWAALIIVAVVAILVAMLINKKRTTAIPPLNVRSDFNMFRSRQAWNISLFIGLQSVIYYCIVSWLPIVLIDFGMPKSEIGWVLFTFQMATIPLTFIGPVIANRMKQQQPLVLVAFVLMISSILIFAWMPLSWVYAAAILLGVSNGLAFSLALLFFSIRTRTSSHAIQLSGMAQSVGYLIAAFGPPIFGKLHDFDASWKSSFYFLGICIICFYYFGRKAASNRLVEE